MYKIETIEGRILEGWEKAETSSGVPYYINHKTENTQWDHPSLLSFIEDTVESCAAIKYAAYRMAVKIEKIQRALYFDNISLKALTSVFEQHGFKADENESLVTCNELLSLLLDLYSAELRDKFDVCLGEANFADLVTNFLLNLFDRHRLGQFKLLAVKVALVLLCSGRLQEKYRYLFRQCADDLNLMDSRTLGKLLHHISAYCDCLSENSTFGYSLIPATVSSCFQQQKGSQHGLTEDMFLQWLYHEPQTLVWLSTHSRLTLAQSVTHNVRCAVCKVYPIVGFRYQCLKCFNYDQCQSCFFHGTISRSHKLNHPIQEYCYTLTSKQETKVFMQRLKNKLTKKTSSDMKQRYLPIIPAYKTTAETSFDSISLNRDSGITADDVAVDFTADGSGESSAPSLRQATALEKSIAAAAHAILMPEQQRELESIVVHLEDENRQLKSELDKLHVLSEGLKRASNCSRQSSPLRMVDSNGDITLQDGSAHRADEEKKDLILARQDVLEQHHRRFEVQLSRLRMLLSSYAGKPADAVSYAGQNGRYCMESTPAVHASGRLMYDRTRLNSICSPITRCPLNRSMRLGQNHEINSFGKRGSLPRPYYSQPPSPLPCSSDAFAYVNGDLSDIPDSRIFVPSQQEFNTSGSDLTSGQFTLPSPSSRDVVAGFTQMQVELEDILKQLESAFPINRRPNSEPKQLANKTKPMVEPVPAVLPVTPPILKGTNGSLICK